MGEKIFVEIPGDLTPLARRSYEAVNADRGRFSFTDLTRTSLGGVQNKHFRLFTPVKLERMRLPTALPEFWSLRHYANLSDSPVTTAARLGGHWSEYNLAAITQVSACNFRCSYCYVDYRHLAGHDSFEVTPAELVTQFVALQDRLRAQGRNLAIMRISGGEPLLAPRLVAGAHRELVERGLLDTSVVLKVESNASMLPLSMAQLSAGERAELATAAKDVTLHVTIHDRPGGKDWRKILDGIELAISVGFNLYPAIGGADWTREDMRRLLDELYRISPGLPLRLAVRPFILTYEILRDRRNLPRIDNEDDAPSLKWERLLQEKTGRSYMTRPRHQVAIG